MGVENTTFQKCGTLGPEQGNPKRGKCSRRPGTGPFVTKISSHGPTHNHQDPSEQPQGCWEVAPGPRASGAWSCPLESFGKVKKKEKFPCNQSNKRQEGKKMVWLDGVWADQGGEEPGQHTCFYTRGKKAPK